MTKPKKPQHWAQEKERGTVFGIQLIMYCFKFLGATVCKIIMVPVLFYYFLFNHKARRNLHRYLMNLNHHFSTPANSLNQTKVLPASKTVPLANNYQVWKIFFNFGMGIVDKMLVWQGNFKRFNLTKSNSEIFLDSIAANQGGVILVSHLGNFEISRMFSNKHKNTRFNIFMHTQNAQKITRVIQKMNPKYTVSIIQGDGLNMHTAMLLKEKVDAGEFVVIAGDRIPVNNEEAVVTAQLLGKTADFPIGPYVLAKVLACPLIGLTCTHRGGRDYHLKFELYAEQVKFNRTNRPQVLAECAQKYASSLEQHIQQSPLQWYNFHNFWQQ